MALTIGYLPKPYVDGTWKIVEAELGFDASYPSGGYTLVAREFGLTTITWVDDTIAEGYMVRYVRDSMPAKIRVFGADDTTGNMLEVANGTNLSAVNDVRLRIRGW